MIEDSLPGRSRVDTMTRVSLFALCRHAVAAWIVRLDGVVTLEVSRAADGTRDLGQLAVRADGHGVHAQPLGAAGPPDGVAAAAEHAAEGTSPASDLNGKADYRQHLARVLTRRAVTAAAGG